MLFGSQRDRLILRSERTKKKERDGWMKYIYKYQ